MRLKQTLAVASTAALLTVAACGGGDDDDTQKVDELSQAGVPVNASPLPMPEQGVAYNNPQPRDNIKDGGSLTLPIDNLGPNFNGMNVDGNSVATAEIMMWTQPMLWDYDEKGTPSPNPNYLESVEQVSDDPQTIKYTVNPDAKWNDGTPIDWRSFKTTWITNSGDSRYNPASTVGYDTIKSVEKGEKDNEVIVTWKTPSYPYQLAFPQLLHPKNSDPEYYKSGWINNMDNDLLSGPYIVDELTKDTLTLKPNPKWWGPEPKLDTVTYNQMEPTAAVNAFRNGQIDDVEINSGDALEQLRDVDGAVIRRNYDKATAVYSFGQDSALFKDDAAREAFVRGTDREQLIEIAFQGLDWEEEPPGSANIFPWQEGYEDNLGELGEYDPEAAKQILDDAGWVEGDDGYREKDGQVAEFTYVNFGDDPVAEATARAQQQMAKEIGLKMNIDNRPAADFSKALTDGDYDVIKMGWVSSDPYGWVWACQLMCSDSESNYSGLGSPEIDKGLKAVAAEKDPAKAVEIMNEAEKKSLALVGMFPLYAGPKMDAAKEDLANYAGASNNGGLAGFMLPHAEDIGWQK
ncbi:ABC transporter family substrate-binding protein [Solicola gregarius]|uniref:ABC transporter family substrate-binding protein n=1 Tax=Solicola gregarius TaxID=2908642 RepID=A0AA46TEE4_9ACTN|nr:ABC transporter family substrate-binding protein [Solicola gregarius]UYM03663.1 ABC transporter family substrate-binding protein [Solicola gregarius]